MNISTIQHLKIAGATKGFGRNYPPMPVRLAIIDDEGAERDCIPLKELAEALKPFLFSGDDK